MIIDFGGDPDHDLDLGFFLTRYIQLTVLSQPDSPGGSTVRQRFVVPVLLLKNKNRTIFTLPPVGGQGIVFGRFLSLFLCQQHYEKTAGPICMKFSGKVWSDHGTT